MNDLKFAFRQLAKNPGFTAVAVVALALGIGANTALFSIVHAVLLRPLPFPAQHELVQVTKEWQPPWLTHKEWTSSLAFREILAWREDNRAFSQMAAYESKSVSLTAGGEPRLLNVGRVSASFFDLLGARPRMGRVFLPEEDRPGGPPVAILSYGAWNTCLGGDANVVGRTVTLDTKPCTVVGVLGPGFRFMEKFDVYVPLALKPGDTLTTPQVIGRLRPGMTVGQAGAALDLVYKQVCDPKENGRIALVRLKDYVTGDWTKSLLVYAAGLAFVLLMACANVANLLLVRAASRQKEMAIRLALGAGRSRIIRSALSESVLLAVLGASLGLLVASWLKGLLCALLGNLPAVNAVRIDGSALAFALLVAVTTGLLVGLAPALRLARLSTWDSIGNSLRGSVSTSRSTEAGRYTLRDSLVIFEITLAFALLVGAGLLARSFSRLRGTDLGFRPDRVLSCCIDLNESKYPNAASRTAYFEQLIQLLKRLPGVEAVGANSSLPLGPIENGTYTRIQGTPSEHPPSGTRGVWGGIVVHYGTVTPDYLRTLGIPVKKGRGFTDEDRAGKPLVALVNESFVQRNLPNQEPLGRRIASGTNWLTIVGVVGDTLEKGPTVDADTWFYRCYLQDGGKHEMYLAVRTRGEPMRLAGAVRNAILSLDRDQRFSAFATLEQWLGDILAPRKLNVVLAGTLSALALGLAILGIYGVVSFTVLQRTHEIGIRTALGAERSQITRLVLGWGLRLAGVGVLLGNLASFWLTSFLAGFLWQIGSLDVPTFITASLSLVLIALLACYLPARRAARADPLAALRCE